MVATLPDVDVRTNARNILRDLVYLLQPLVPLEHDRGWPLPHEDLVEQIENRLRNILFRSTRERTISLVLGGEVMLGQAIDSEGDRLGTDAQAANPAVSAADPI